MCHGISLPSGASQNPWHCLYWYYTFRLSRTWQYFIMVAILLAAFGARSGTDVHFTCYFLSSWSTGQLFRAFHWHLFRLPALAGSGFLRVGPNFVSVCVIRFSFGAFLDFDGSFEHHELTTIIFPRVEPFSLVQHCSKFGIFGSDDTFCFTTRHVSSSPRLFSSFRAFLA